MNNRKMFLTIFPTPVLLSLVLKSSYHGTTVALGFTQPYLSHRLQPPKISTKKYLNLDDAKPANYNAPSTKSKGLTFDPKVSRRQAMLSFLALTGVTTSLAKPSDFALAVTATAAAVSILKPPLDSRKYEFFTLENGLRVLICSDPSSNSAAAAMDVHVGATSDPPEVKGLAHFTEHMLFLGTKKFPGEDSFSVFLSANGGFSNAYTDSENTVYYFDMDGDSNFQQGLERFGSFFSGPLFTESATDRELNAIESENAKNLQSDTFRLFQIEKSRANSDHPFSKFFTGNKFTLLEETKKNNINLRNELIKFYEKYYSANQMTAAVVAPQPLATLKEYAIKAFSDIPNRDISKPEESWKGYIAPFNGQSSIPSTGYIVEMVPVSDLRQVTVTWPIVYSYGKEENDMKLLKPDFYVAHLLGHEGEKSLLSFLKSKGLANTVACSSGNELSDFSTIDVTVELTNKGFLQVNLVVEAIFTYIRMLTENPIPDYIFEECLNLSDLEWRYLTKSEPSKYVTLLATSAQEYDPSLVIAGNVRLALKDGNKILDSSKPRRTFSSYNQLQETKAATNKLIEYLTVENVMVTIISKQYKGKTNMKEYWYQTDYQYRQIPPDLKAKLSNPTVGAKFISFPKPNKFIPSEEGLKVKLPVEQDDSPMTFEARMKPISPPKVIRDTDRWTAYFKQDDRFGKPKAFIIFELLRRGIYDSPLDAVYSTLFELSAADRLDEYNYGASLAGLSTSFVVIPRGIRITFGGYNDKLQEYASYVTNKLVRDMESTLPATQAEFDRYIDTITRSLQSFDVKQPYAQAIYFSSLAQSSATSQFANSELREALLKTNIKGLRSYVKQLFSGGKGVALIQGNLIESEAFTLLDTIDKTLGFSPLSDIPEVIKPLPLPLTPTRFTIQTPNPDNRNSVCQVTFQSLSRSDKSHVLIQLLSAIIQEPFYDDLRTKQQLGYIVSSGVKAIEESRSLSLVIQSSVAPVEKLTSEVLRFVDGVEEKLLVPLKKGDFATYVKGLIDKKTEKDKNLSTEVTRNWSEIINGRFRFDRVQREAQVLLDLEKEDLLTFWRDLTKGANRRMFISEVVPVSGDAASSVAPKRSYGFTDETLPGSQDKVVRIGIDDMPEFRKSREGKETMIS